MNKNNSISTLINTLKIKQAKLNKDARNIELEINSINNLSLKNEITFEDEVIAQYLMIKTIKGTVKHFNDSSITTPSGLAITQPYVSELIKGTSKKTNKVLLRMAKKTLNTNKAGANQRVFYR